MPNQWSWDDERKDYNKTPPISQEHATGIFQCLESFLSLIPHLVACDSFWALEQAETKFQSLRTVNRLKGDWKQREKEEADAEVAEEVIQVFRSWNGGDFDSTTELLKKIRKILA